MKQGAVAWVLLLLLFALDCHCWADNTPVRTLPVQRVGGRPPPPSPWAFEVDASGIDGHAYRGIKVAVRSTSGPVNEAHRLQVVLAANGNRHQADETVTAFIEVPEGAATTTAIIDVPQRNQWHLLSVQILEDGKLVPGCESVFNLPRTNFRNRVGDTATVLVIDRDAPTRAEYRAVMANITSSTSELKGRRQLPDVRWLLAVLPANQMGNTGRQLFYTQEEYDDRQLLQTFHDHEGIDLLPPQELSTRWLSQSNADLTVIALDDLVLLRSQYPDRHEALMRWTMAGGSLLVYGCGEEWKRLPEVAQLTGLPSDEPIPGEDGSSWRLPSDRAFTDSVEGIFDTNRGYSYGPSGGISVDYGVATVEGVPVTTPAESPASERSSRQFAVRRLGLGTVVAYQSDNPFPGQMNDWAGLWNTLGSHQFLWTRRHGLAHDRRNLDFWNFVIPGVGEAPVFSFVTMIGLFMLIIGPLNYYYLRRWRRLSMMLVTVPLGAGIFTFGLFAFALLSDGFSTRSRIRSLTVLEQHSGRAAAMSRQTYYTAFVPSDGMHYPPDTAVYPLHYAPYDEAERGHFFDTDSQWNNGELNLQRKYLTARQHRQFVTVRSTQTAARLEVRPVGNKLGVRNDLGVKIQLGIVSNDQGQLHLVENLEPGASTQLSPVDSKIVANKWHAIINPKTPQLSREFNQGRYDMLMGRRNRYYGPRNNSPWEATQSTSALEIGIRETDSRLLGSSGTAGGAEPRMFVMVVPDSILGEDERPLAPLGVAGSRLMESLHVVRGKW